eukprot:TRINITY_DN5534_c0_g2_i1.p1 TRINITY_DN5534_c0_g2~~TRINITY_DN5534_c0_g2_i1.p1  ORF type:complete len:131 (+),score=21.29 TRINITY_DN5534_c0_g2_i1:56-394(+)
MASASRGSFGDVDPAMEAKIKALSHFEEHAVKLKMTTHARQMCDDYFKKFEECSKSKRMAVVWQCREEWAAVSACTSRFTSPEWFKQHKIEYIVEAEKAAKAAGLPPNKLSK